MIMSLAPNPARLPRLCVLGYFVGGKSQLSLSMFRVTDKKGRHENAFMKNRSFGVALALALSK
jgi:hypothetical protein